MHETRHQFRENLRALEEQALGPIRADAEMNLPIDQLLARLKSVPEYGPLFRALVLR